jgi:glycosyltransferase involved in cell wall biosynthesis
LLLNNDTLPKKDWLRNLLELIDKDDKIGLVGSKLLFPDERLQEAGGIIWNDGTASHYGRGGDPAMPEYNYVKEVDYISGASLMIRNELWKEIGGFDARFTPAYYEDVDLAFEVRKRGFKVVYQPKSVVVHFETVSCGADLGEGSERHQRENRKKFFDKWKEFLDLKPKNHPQEVFHIRDRTNGKKTVLVVEHSVPDFDKHAGSRTSFHYLRIFLELGLNVKFIDDNFIKFGINQERYTTVLEQLGIEVLSHEWHRKNWEQWIKDHARYVDYVFLNRPISIDYIDTLRRETKAKIVYNCVDFHYLREMRQYEISKNRDFLRLSKEHKKQEFYLFKNSDVILTYSDYEKSILDRELPGKTVRVIPLFIYDEPFPLGMDTAFEKRGGLMFVGGFAHDPNVDGISWFVKDIFPNIVERGHEIELSIIGSNPPEEILKLKSRYVDSVGYVPDERLQQYYSNTRIAIAPLRFGAGIKGKIIEAIVHGVPVVTTEVGREGIKDIDGIVCVADRPDEFAKRVVDIYMDKQKWTDMRNKQIDYANRHFSQEYARNLVRDILEI